MQNIFASRVPFLFTFGIWDGVFYNMMSWALGNRNCHFSLQSINFTEKIEIYSENNRGDQEIGLHEDLKHYNVSSEMYLRSPEEHKLLSGKPWD